MVVATARVLHCFILMLRGSHPWSQLICYVLLYLPTRLGFLLLMVILPTTGQAEIMGLRLLSSVFSLRIIATGVKVELC
jgi:hypothetical protein